MESNIKQQFISSSENVFISINKYDENPVLISILGI